MLEEMAFACLIVSSRVGFFGGTFGVSQVRYAQSIDAEGPPMLPDPSSWLLVPRHGLHAGTFQHGHPSASPSSSCCVAGDRERRRMRWGGFFFSWCVFPAFHLPAAVRVYLPAWEGGGSGQTALPPICNGVKCPVNVGGAT